MRKILNLLTASFAVILLMVTGSGCLKDKLVDDGLTGPLISTSPKLVELMGAVEGTTSYQSSSVVAFDIGTQTKTSSLVSVRLASNDAADKDIQVQLEYMPSLIQSYNDTNATHYTALPANKFTLSDPNLSVTIPRGSREGSLNISLIPSDLLGGEYALGFRIKSVSDPSVKISGNFSNLFVIVAVKNIYDGIYEVAGTMEDRVNPALTGRFPMTVHLITTGTHSVAMFDPEVFHDYIHPINNAGNPSGYGSFAPVFNFDPSGNGKVLSIVNYHGQPAASNGRSAGIDPSGVNQWNPTTKEMKVKFFMFQPGTTIRTTFDETFTYKGPR